MTGEATRGARHRGGFAGRLGLAVLAAVGALGLLGLVLFAAHIDPVERQPTRHADGIVVLTGGLDRVPDGIALLLAGHGDRLLITGVNPTTSREDIARQHPGARPLADCCIDLGYEAVNTIGNARETADWVHVNKLHSLIVVTSNYHMPRALAEIAAALPDTDLQPYPVVPERSQPEPWWSNPHRTRLIVGEYVKYLVAQARLALSRWS